MASTMSDESLAVSCTLPPVSAASRSISEPAEPAFRATTYQVMLGGMAHGIIALFLYVTRKGLCRKRNRIELSSRHHTRKVSFLEVQVAIAFNS